MSPEFKQPGVNKNTIYSTFPQLSQFSHPSRQLADIISLCTQSPLSEGQEVRGGGRSKGWGVSDPV